MSPAACLQDLVGYLDGYLRVAELPDAPNAHNGLQVENRGSIARIVAAVDASLATIEGAAGGPRKTLLIVHHGLFWDGAAPVTDRRYRRLRALLEADLALYSAHIPLDLHPEVGNNAVLARRLGIQEQSRFGAYRDVPIGIAGELLDSLPRERFLERVEAELGLSAGAARLVPGGPASVRRVGVITGAAGDMIAAAGEAGVDTFVTGEGPAHSYFDAMELGLNVIYAGHYATETVGVRALGEHVAGRFHLPWEFHDHPTGM